MLRDIRTTIEHVFGFGKFSVIVPIKAVELTPQHGIPGIYFFQSKMLVAVQIEKSKATFP